MGTVEILWSLDLLLGRAAAVGAEFVLAGPVSMWLRDFTPPPKEARFIVVTDESNAEPLLQALSVGSRRLEWGPEWRAVEGKAARLLVRGALVEVLVNPRISGVDIDVSRLARESDYVVIGKYVARLAPTWFEVSLASALGVGEDPTSC